MGNVKEKRICNVENCSKNIFAKGYCRKHYDKFRNYGDAEHVTRKDRNTIEYNENYAKIILSNTGNIAIVDVDMVEKIKHYKWYEQDEYVKAIIDGKSTFLHRFIMNDSTKEMIDHIDRNKLNNRIENLRCATRIENSINKGIQSNNKSGVVGVSWHKQHEKWYANIVVNKKNIFLGLFDKIEDAKRVRVSAEIEYFGEYRSDAND